MRPRRDSRACSNSSPSQAGLGQKNDAFGKNTVPHVVQRLPSSTGSSSIVNQSAMAGTRVRLVGISDTASDYTSAMPPIVPAGRLVFGIQLPVQAQSKYFVEPWETSAGPDEVARVAQAADRSGFFYVAVCDHVAIPDDLAPRMGAVWWDTIATL